MPPPKHDTPFCSLGNMTSHFLTYVEIKNKPVGITFIVSWGWEGEDSQVTTAVFQTSIPKEGRFAVESAGVGGDAFWACPKYDGNLFDPDLQKNLILAVIPSADPITRETAWVSLGIRGEDGVRLNMPS